MTKDRTVEAMRPKITARQSGRHMALLMASGMRPTMVVREVLMMGRSRSAAPLAAAWRTSIPSRRWVFMVSTMTMASLATIPMRAMIPTMAKKERSVPVR